MTANRDQESLIDIADALQQIQLTVQALTFDEFTANREKQAAVLYFLIVMGEATKRLSQELRNSNPETPWKQMAGMRDVMAHQYDRVDLDTIWEITQVNIPEILSQVQSLIVNDVG
jgi:uncharacterized protein with HEPN domain